MVSTMDPLIDENSLISNDEDMMDTSQPLTEVENTDSSAVNNVIPTDPNEEQMLKLECDLSSPFKDVRVSSLKSFQCILASRATEKGVRLIKLCLQIEEIKIDPFNYREVLRLMSDVTSCAKDPNDELSSIAFHYLLGFLFVNFTLLWPAIRDAICHSLTGNDKRRPYFMKSVINKLDFSSDEKPGDDSTGSAKANFVSYRSNILKILESCCSLTHQYNRLFIAYFFQLHDSMVSLKETQVENEEDSGPVKIQSTTWNLLEGYLRVLSTFTNIKSVHRCEDLERIFKSLLKNPRPNIQEYSFKCICNYNDTTLTAYKDQLLQIIDEKTFKSALIAFNVNAASEEDRSLPDKHRSIVMPILLSILTGKLKYKTPQRKVKSASQAKKPIILRFIGACKVNEIMCFLGNILEPFTYLLEVPIDEAVLTVEKSFESVKFHTLESSVKTLNFCFEYFGNVDFTITSYLSRALIIIAGHVKNTLDSEEKKKADLKVCHAHDVQSDCEVSESKKCSIDDDADATPVIPATATGTTISKRIINCIYRYRELRSSCIKLSIIIFKELREQVLPAREIHSLFTLLINPSLNSVKCADITTVPQVISLLLVFSEDSRFFPLLDYRITPDSLSPFDVLVRSLNDVKESRLHPLTDVILTIVCNLLTLDAVDVQHTQGEDGEMSVDQPSLTLLKLDVTCKTAGIDLVKPHASTILSCYKRLLTGITSGARKSNKRSLGTAKGNIKPRDLQILKYFGTLVTSEDDCYTLASLLIEILRITYTKHTQNTEYFIDAISKLCEVCPSYSSSLLPSLAPLFYTLRENRFRSQLAQLVSSLITNIPSGEWCIPIVNGIVSIHKLAPNLIDQPDYGAKFQGYKEITQHLHLVQSVSSPLILPLMQMLAYSACHTLLYDSDPGVTSAAIDLMFAMATNIAPSPESKCGKNVFTKIVINIFVMRGIKQAFRNKQDTVRGVFIDLLQLLFKFAPFDPILRDLASLSDASDIEVDFWNNVKHIQRHRRARAFLRLTNNCSLLASMRNEVVWNFLLPLAEANVHLKEQKHHLSTSAFSSSSPSPSLSSTSKSLEKASIELIGVLSRFFTWKQYKIFLRKYLGKFTDASLTVSVDVVSRILTNFPFDISNAQYEKCNLKLIHEKEKKKSGQKGVLLETRPEFTNVDVTVTRRATTAQTTDTRTTTTITTSKKMNQVTPFVKKIMTPEEATFIFNEMKSIIVHDICTKIFEMAYVDYDADRMKNTFDENEQVHRIPLAIAVVRLLIQFPRDSGLLDIHLNGILLRLLHFLKCKSEQIRRVARKALQTITLDLGTSYLPFILRELKNSLTKGFQRHILSFTVHFLLYSLNEKKYVTNDCLDVSSMLLLFDICVDDLLGSVSEEKSVGKIINKTIEARKAKANDILYLMGIFCNTRTIFPLLDKFISLLTTASTYRILKKISTALDYWINGLTVNTSVSIECLLAFSHKIMQDASTKVQIMGEKFSQSKLVQVEEKMKSQWRRKVDSLVIDPASVNNRKASKQQHAHNQHTVVLIEKATSLLLTLLESTRIHGSSSSSVIPLVDLFVPSLTEHLSAKHVKLLSYTLRVLLLMNRKFSSLPSLVQHSPIIKNRIFVLMSQHSGFKSNEGSTQQLTDLCFKSMASLIARKEVELSTDQLAVLLSHIDQDLEDGAGKPASFTLLKAIIVRRLESNELNEIMKKISHMAIQCEDESIRKRCVSTWITYLQSYLRGKVLQEHLLFIVRQLEYKREAGRLSALTVLAAAVRALPVSSLKTNQPVLLVPLACRLINENSSKCKELAFCVMKQLLRNLGSLERDNIFTSLVLPCLHASDIRQKSLATFLATLFQQIEKATFTKNRWPIVSPVFAEYLCTVAANEKKKRKKKLEQLTDNDVEQDEENEQEEEEDTQRKEEEKEEEEEEDEAKRREVALLLFQQLSLVLEVMKAGENSKWIRSEPGLQSILGAVEECYLRFAHSWVRLISARVLGHLFSLYAPQELAEKAAADAAAAAVAVATTAAASTTSLSTQSQSNSRDAAHDEFLLREPENRLPLLTRGFVLLFYNTGDLQPLGEQLVMNLAFVARVLVLTARLAPPSSSLCPKLTMSWFLKQILKPAAVERARNAHCIRIRLLVLKLMALIILEFQREELLPLLPLLLPTLAKEVTTNSSNTHNTEQEQLYSHAQQIIQMIRSLVGADQFNSTWTSVQSALRLKKLARKQIQAQNRVIAPSEETANRLNKRKKQSEKRHEIKRKRLMR